MHEKIDELASWLAFCLARKEQLVRAEEGAAHIEVLDEAIAEARAELRRLLRGSDWLDDEALMDPDESDIPY